MIYKSANKILTAVLFAMVVTTIAIAQDSLDSQKALLAKLQTPDRVHDVDFSPDGKLIAAGFGWSTLGGAMIWNASDQSLIATLATGKEEGSNVEQISFSKDGKLFAIANWKGDTLLWNVGSWKSFKTVISKKGSPKSLSFSSDSTRLLYASEDEVIVYNLRTTKSSVLARKASNGPFINASFASDNKEVYLFRENMVEILDLESGHTVKTWKPKGFSFFGEISRDGNNAIGGGGAIFGEKSVEIWNAKNGNKLGELSNFRSGLFALSISNSGELFAISGGDYGAGGDISLWNLRDATEVGYVSFGDMPIHGLAFSPDDKTLAAGSDNGYVLLYAVERFRGPQLKKQDYSLCGEILVEDKKTFIVPLSKVPAPMRPAFGYNWKLEVINSDTVAGSIGLPVELSQWYISSSADRDRIRIGEFKTLRKRDGHPIESLDHIIFGDIKNPGWNEGSITKIYSDGTFVVSNNPGRCLAYGSLDKIKTDFNTLKKRLVDSGLVKVPQEPITLGASHYRTRFIEIVVDGVPQLRSDADDIGILLKGGQAKKREAFSTIFTREEQLLDSLLKAGVKGK